MKKKPIICLALSILIACHLSGCGQIYTYEVMENKPNADATEKAADEEMPDEAEENNESTADTAETESEATVESAADTAETESEATVESAADTAETESETTVESAADTAETEDTADKSPATYTMADIAKLQNTGYFLDSAIEHIFSGTINKKGNATGYHYDAVTDSEGEIVEGTKSECDENGVYEGKVRVSGIDKSGNGGYSTFYPESMSPQEVVDAINEAYENKQRVNGSLFAGLTDEGIEIDMALTDDGKIITAYPIMED